MAGFGKGHETSGIKGAEVDPLGFFIEPEWCVDLLIANAKFEGTIYDPACGSGTIPRVFNRRGIHASGSDIAPRTPGFGVFDFLKVSGPPPGDIRSIVSNPPYVIGEAFIRHAMAIGRPGMKVAMLMQSKFIFSAKRANGLFREFPPTRILLISPRPSMPPGKQYLAGEIEAKGGRVDYVWIIWDVGERPTQTAAEWVHHKKIRSAKKNGSTAATTA